MKNINKLMVLALFTATSQAIQISKDPSEKELMAAIGAALDDAGGDAGGSDVAAAIEDADKAGDLPNATEEVKKDTPKDMLEPAAVALEDENGNKKTEVEILME
jgi:hypothetical protein